MQTVAENKRITNLSVILALLSGVSSPATAAYEQADKPDSLSME
jgi:hypothetical protein